MACAGCRQKYEALKAARTPSRPSAPLPANPRKIKARRGVIKKTPLTVKDGVTVGEIVPKSSVAIDPSTGQEVSVIKTGKSSTDLPCDHEKLTVKEPPATPASTD